MKVSDNANKIVVIVPGILPMPPVRGGAVENLLYNVVKVNEEVKKMHLVIYSVHNEEAVQEATKYKQTEWQFYKIPSIVDWCDKFIYMCVKILGCNNVQSFRFIGQRLYYIYKIAQNLNRRDDVKIIVLDNHVTLCMVLWWFGNYKKYINNVFYHAHNEIKGYWGMKKYFLGLGKYICVSQFIGNTIKKMGVENKKIKVLTNVVDTDRFANRMTEAERVCFRKKYGINKNDFVVFTAGRIVPEKGIKEALIGFQQANIKHSKLVLAGGTFFASKVKNSYEQEVNEIIQKMPDRVLMLGYIPYDEMPKWYQCADVGLFPSIWDEPAFLTGIEARSAGLPVITTVSGGIPEYIKPEFGILLNRDENLEENIADSLKMLSENAIRLKDMSEKARQYSRQYDLYTYYEAFYQQVGNV